MIRGIDVRKIFSSDGIVRLVPDRMRKRTDTFERTMEQNVKITYIELKKGHISTESFECFPQRTMRDGDSSSRSRCSLRSCHSGLAWMKAVVVSRANED